MSTEQTRQKNRNDESAAETAYERALARFAATDPAFGGGLANHGPMAAEALLSMGQADRIDDFVADYVPRLEPGAPAEPGAGYWQDQLHDAVRSRAGAVATQAGHGVLRLAHIARGLTRAAELDNAAGPGADAPSGVTVTHRRELTAASAYWGSGGPGLPSPPTLTGDRTVEEWLDGLPAFPDDFEYPWLLTGTLSAAAERPGFVDAVAALRPAADRAETLDLLASASIEVYLRNTETAAFAAIHGVTAPTMTRQLLAFADDETADQLVASAAGFVAAAVVGFDRGPDPDHTGQTDEPRGETGLAAAAAATLDDHTIKFSDACIHLARRTGSDRPLVAAWHRVEETTA